MRRWGGEGKTPQIKFRYKQIIPNCSNSGANKFLIFLRSPGLLWKAKMTQIDGDDRAPPYYRKNHPSIVTARLPFWSTENT